MAHVFYTEWKILALFCKLEFGVSTTYVSAPYIVCTQACAPACNVYLTIIWSEIKENESLNK